MRKSKKIQLLRFRWVWIIFTFFHGVSLGQSDQQIWFHSIPTTSGFSQSYNYYIFQDSEGFIWISSGEGLNRFDGQRVKLYQPDNLDSTALNGGMIYGNFFEDDNHDIWFSTNKAIHRYQRKTDDFSHFFLQSNPDSVKRDYHTFAFEDNQYLWLKASSGIYRYDTQNNRDSFILNTTLYYVKAGFNELNQMSKIFIYGGGEKDTGIEIINPQNGFQLEASTVLQNDKILEIFYENDSLVWLSSEQNGILAWNPIQDKIMRFEGLDEIDAREHKCSFVKLDTQHLLLFIEGKGIYKYNKEEDIIEFIDYQIINEKANSTIDFWTVYHDDNGTIWTSDRINGCHFSFLGKNKFLSIPKFPTLDKNNKYSLRIFLEDDDNVLWCATENGGVFKYDILQKKIIDHYCKATGLPSDTIWDIIKDKNGKIWIVTTKGVLFFNEKTNEFSKIPIEVQKEGDEDNYFTSAISLRKEGDILVTSLGNGIFKLVKERSKYKLKQIYNWNTNVDCESIFEDKKGNIIVTFLNQGISIFKYKKGKFTLTKELPIEAQITDLWEDEFSETLWIATTNGLLKTSIKDGYTVPQLVPLNYEDLGKSIRSVIGGSFNNIWLGMSNGLVRFHKDSTVVQKFSLADGTQSNEFNVGSNIKKKNGELWLGGNDGITIIPPFKIDSVKTIPKIKITNIKINDLAIEDLVCEKTQSSNISQIKHLSRPYEDNTISLEFVAMNYSDPTGNQLEYQLEKVDNKPVRLKKGDYGFARYPNLSPGTYSFRLRGANSDGVWGEQNEVLKITIRPPFYQTWWFYLISTLFLGIIGYAIYKYRINQIEEKAMLNTRIAENKMAALRAQMNPHFIYNSMQTVNGIISRKDNIGAVKYINKFSRLMRMILENSRKGKISLDKEIELLRAYMEIEKRRFNNPFTYSITVDEEIDTFDTEIPSMLTQPFIENAIKHGIFHKKEQGHIDLKFIRENGSFKCIIEDNGIGRAKSTELNNQTGRNHRSRGLEIVDDRLAIIRQSHPGNYKVKISDLFDLEHQPSGTRVEITLPFEV